MPGMAPYPTAWHLDMIRTFPEDEQKSAHELYFEFEALEIHFWAPWVLGILASLLCLLIIELSMSSLNRASLIPIAMAYLFAAAIAKDCFSRMSQRKVDAIKDLTKKDYLHLQALLRLIEHSKFVKRIALRHGIYKQIKLS